MDFEGLWYECNDLDTNTSVEQCECEQECARFLKPLSSLNQKALNQLREADFINSSNEWLLLRDKHIAYLLKSLQGLSKHFITLDASKPWILYWVTHGLYLLGHDLDEHDTIRLYDTLKHIQNSYSSNNNNNNNNNNNSSSSSSSSSSGGGFGGGPSQLSHAAPNYAAVLALCTIAYSHSSSSSSSDLSSEMIYDLIDRKGMYKWFLSLKDDTTGGFRMHKDGEIDARASYTVLSISRILNILTNELKHGVKEYLLSCQTYEGGFGGEPFNEAHGGYNFCALAGLYILNAINECDENAQEQWLLMRQMKLEGGFQGRTNKLVDSCYSFWQGAACAMISRWKDNVSDVILPNNYNNNNINNNNNNNSNGSSNSGSNENGDEMVVDVGVSINSPTSHNGHMSFNQLLLQRYILLCSQQTTGGLRDKPGKSRDYYHTCYSLSGLAISQRTPPNKNNNSSDGEVFVYGDACNLVNNTNPIFNIGEEALSQAVEYYSKKGSCCTHAALLS